MFDALHIGSRDDSDDGDTALEALVKSDVRRQVQFESDAACRSILGVPDDASWQQICSAHASLVSDMTPGPDAEHGRVELALSMLNEVNQAFATLQRKAVA